MSVELLKKRLQERHEEIVRKAEELLEAEIKTIRPLVETLIISFYNRHPDHIESITTTQYSTSISLKNIPDTDEGVELDEKINEEFNPIIDLINKYCDTWYAPELLFDYNGEHFTWFLI